MTKLFITGATGYIGGDALYAIVHAHPEYEITALVRNSAKGAKVVKDYPKIKLVYGDLDSVDLIEEEAKKADVVCHFANADHTASASAIIAGLAAHPASSPGFYIHTSGTGVLMHSDMQAQTFGEAFSEKIYDDLANIAEVTSLPDAAPHRNVEKLVLAAPESVRTAIVCPPVIYGAGRGPDNQRSVQIPALCRVTLQRGYGVRVNAGLTYWGTVHVTDLSQLYLRLVEEAAAGAVTAEWSGKPATWGAEGYYFCENGEIVWGEVAGWVAEEAARQGWIQSAEVKSISAEDAAGVGVPGHVLWGANSRGQAKRAREVLKWEPTGPGLKEEIRGALEVEVKALELKTPHAAVAAEEA